jgi:hypothetical protein
VAGYGERYSLAEVVKEVIPGLSRHGV